VRTDLQTLQAQIEKIGAENIVCVLSTSSCFAPRAPDKSVLILVLLLFLFLEFLFGSHCSLLVLSLCRRVVEIAQLCKKYDIPHVINNAYGVQCALSCSLVTSVRFVFLVFLPISSPSVFFHFAGREEGPSGYHHSKH
jgi:O-phospho-L-seryl-tRNASec:L-selenocysteinyl-tRNA synthase